jgi:hypothetical protein
MLTNPEDAIKLLAQLGAPARLLQHVKLVGEAAELLIGQLDQLNIQIDQAFIRTGVIFHDAGKILYQAELSNKGNQHEAAGEQLLLQHGVDARLARCCRSHAQWQSMDCSLEELVIALADHLWKGKRSPELELAVIDECAVRLNCTRWDIFVVLDSHFESIAANGNERLRRSGE